MGWGGAGPSRSQGIAEGPWPPLARLRVLRAPPAAGPVAVGFAWMGMPWRRWRRVGSDGVAWGGSGGASDLSPAPLAIRYFPCWGDPGFGALSGGLKGLAGGGHGRGGA